MASQPGFWDDQAQAQRQMRQLDEVKAQLEQLGRWAALVDDAKATRSSMSWNRTKSSWGRATRGSNVCGPTSTAGNWSVC